MGYQPEAIPLQEGDMRKQKFVVVVEKVENNYSAYSPGLDGCVATGDTIFQTIDNMKEAIRFHLEGEKLEPSSVVAIEIVSI